MAQDATIISASLNDSELKNSIDNLVRYVDEGTRKMSQSMTNAVEEMKKTLQSLANTKIDMGGTSDGGSSKRTKKQQEEAQAVNNTSVSYDRLADSMQRASQYSDEILKKSKAIRESSEWIKTGHYTSGDTVFYDKDRANVSKRERSQLLSLEEQIEAALLQQEETRRMSTQESARQAQAEQQVAQAASGTQQIYQSIYEMQLRSNEEARKGGIKNTSFANYEDFRQALAGVLGLQKNEVILANEETDAYNKLRATLGQLETAYYNLSAAERKSDNGKALVASIQEVQRAMQKIRSDVARPLSLQSVMGLSEKTIDDIAYKMQKLQSYRSGLDVTAQRNEINQVNQAYDRLKTKMDEVMAKSAQMNTMNNALTRSFNYMKNRLTFYFTVGASTAFVRQLIEIRSQYELTERSLGILIRSAEKGTAIFNELSQMALVSPYTLIELSNAARQLTAYGVAAKDVVDTTRRLADISAAVGAPIERIAYALGHVQSYGYLTSLQARQFANSGIPLVKELANRYSELEGRMVTTADVYDRMKKKQIEYADVIGVINQMTDEGGRFFDYQAKQAETLRVQLANLNLAWNNMLNEMGSSSQGVLTTTIGALRRLFLSWETVSKAMYTLVAAIGLYKARAATTIMLLGKETAKHFLNATALADETTATYQDILAKNKLTTANAKLLLAINRSNVGLRQALINLKLLSVEQANAIANANQFRAVWTVVTSSLTSMFQVAVRGLKAIGLAIANNPLLIIGTIIADLGISLFQLGRVTKEVNESIANSSKEAAKSLEEFIATAKKAGTIEGAKSGSLSSQELEKAWINIREELETSSSANKEIISELLTEEDLGLRVTKAFEWAEKIESARLKMKDLTDQIKISEDVWHGIFGEGIAEDFQDFAEKFDFAKKYSERYVVASTNTYANEANKEMQKLASSIKETFKKENITDPKEVKEALSSIRENIISESEELKGTAATLFRINFDDVMSREWGNKTFDKATTLWNMVLDDIKKNSSSAFSSITTDILDNEGKWSETQVNAIDKAFERIRKDIPPKWKKTLDEMHKELDSQEFKAKILFTFDITKLSSFQEEFKSRITSAFGNLFYQSNISVAPKADENLFTYTQKNIKEIEELEKQESAYSKDKSTYAQSELEHIRTRKKLLEDINRLFNQPTKEDKRHSQNDSVLETLKMEISLVEKLQGDYEKLTKAGASSKDALDAIHNAYGSTIDLLNKNLQGFGLPRLDLSMITGKNPNEQLNYFKELKSLLESKGLANLERIKALDAVIEKLNVKAETYNLDMVTKGLNNELGKLKEEYELGVEFDANPELGDVFADMIGIDKSELAALPRSYEEFIANAQEKINKLFADNNIKLNFNLQDNLNMSKFDEWVKNSGQEVDSKLVEDLKKYVSEANKIRLNETKKQIEEWDKLLGKYAEYEYKKLQIEKDYQREMEVARKKGADDDIKRAIQNNRDREMARINFEQFQQTPTWVTATGDLATMTNDALNILIDRIEEYKRTAKDLDPKQITEINKALRRLRTEQRKDSPFAIIANAIDDAKERFEYYQVQIDQAGARIDELNAKLQKESYLTEAETNELSSLTEKTKKWRDEQESLGKISAKSIVQGLSGVKDMATSVMGSVGDMFAAFGDKDTQESLNKVSGVLNQAASFAAMGAAIGGGWGAAIGGVLGFLMGGISALAEAFSGNASITHQIENSEMVVKRLENAYINLNRAIENAYGTEQYYAERIAAANKQAQLAEIKRQLQLEKSRSSKYHDEEKILDLERQVIELENEIDDMLTEIINDFMGISSVSDAIEDMVGSIIDSLRQGENALESFDKSVDDMIANMVKKVFAEKILGKWFEDVWNTIDQQAKNRTQQWVDDLSRLESLWENRVTSDGEANTSGIIEAYRWMKAYGRRYGIEAGETTMEDYEKIKAFIEEQIRNASEFTIEDIKKYAEMLREGRPLVEDEISGLNDLLRQLGLMKDSTSSLSNLQQGIQGITETTANALEAYMNGVSQQVYLHSDLLTQIRDTLVGFDMDVQNATQAQMLLQLQQSYAVQLAIQSLLQGWSSANGMAVKVEMI